MTATKNDNRVCPAERAGILDNMIRKWIHNPKNILKDHVKAGMVVLDVGCGPGFFTIPMAGLVGPTGKVIAADLQSAMLDKLKNKIIGSDLAARIELHKSTSDRIGVAETVDFILAFYMVHEVPDQIKFFQEIGSILKPDGRILIVEPNFHVSKEDFSKTIKICEEAGLKFVSRIKRILFSRAVLMENK